VEGGGGTPAAASAGHEPDTRGRPAALARGGATEGAREPLPTKQTNPEKHASSIFWCSVTNTKGARHRLCPQPERATAGSEYTRVARTGLLRELIDGVQPPLRVAGVAPHLEVAVLRGHQEAR
jgi:hypothetical protein